MAASFSELKTMKHSNYEVKCINWRIAVNGNSTIM